MKLTVLLENIIREEEDKKAISALDQAMGMSFRALGAELEANKDEIQQDVEQSKAELNEALGAIAIIGAILAAPKVLELLTKGLSAVIKAFKRIFKPKQAKTEEEQEGVAQTIVEFTHKWHKAYIKGVPFDCEVKARSSFQPKAWIDQVTKRAAKTGGLPIVTCRLNVKEKVVPRTIWPLCD